ncbi:unnamed protein product [Lathyrus oleraceus]
MAYAHSSLVIHSSLDSMRLCDSSVKSSLALPWKAFHVMF